MPVYSLCLGTVNIENISMPQIDAELKFQQARATASQMSA